MLNVYYIYAQAKMEWSMLNITYWDGKTNNSDDKQNS